ncbi:MAG: hypothetical protein EBX50_08965 [Chitinophagia bacterium]|nr:hypothetical protein [Chitinophagia bacterium]
MAISFFTSRNYKLLLHKNIFFSGRVFSGKGSINRNFIPVFSCTAPVLFNFKGSNKLNHSAKLLLTQGIKKRVIITGFNFNNPYSPNEFETQSI